MINSADVSMIIYKRMYELAKSLSEQEFINRVEELAYILEKIR